MSWVETSPEVYAVIFARHKKDLTPFASFSNPEPSYLSSQPQMLTEWAFSGATQPILKHVSSWDHGRREETIEHRYWIKKYIGEE